ncbi:MAG: tetratricopeptide repeat protein, partial [Dehalococcoidia bacterium]
MITAVLAAACLGVPAPPTGLEELVDLPDSLPRGPAAARKLLDEGDAAWTRRDDPGMPEAARRAYWHAIAADPQQPEGYWKAARASVLVGQLLEGKEARGDAFLRGLRTTQLLLAREDELAQAHYYYALNLGLLARERPTRGHEAVKEMLPHLERAIELAPQLDRGGAYRTLAMVYLRAPGWPTSVGDEEAGLEYATLAVEKAPDHPGNHLALAEALIAMGDKPRARTEVERARELAAQPRWTQRERNLFLEQATSL